MAATVQIHEMTATDSGVDKTSGTVRFKSADETATGTTNRLVIPGAGTDYSYSKWLQFYVSVAPSVDLQNLRAYSDGANGFGTGIGVQYDTGTQWAASTDANISGTDLFTKVATDNIDMDSGTTIHTGTGYVGYPLRLQMTVASTASPGTLSAETLTCAYDET